MCRYREYRALTETLAIKLNNNRGFERHLYFWFMRKNPTEMKWIWVVFFRRAFHRNQLLNITRAKSLLDRIMREDNIVSFIISDIESTTKCAITEVLTTRSVSWSPKGFLIADIRLKSFINLHFIVGIRFSSEFSVDSVVSESSVACVFVF